MKKTICLVLSALLVIGLCTTVAFAATTRSIRVTPNLTFSSGKANCTATITSYGDNISATMELWQGSNLIDSWSGSRTSSLSLSGSHAAVSGATYTVKVYGTVGGTSFSPVTVSKVCP